MGRPAGLGGAQGEAAATGVTGAAAESLSETLSSARVDVKGTVTEGGEPVVFSGAVEIRARTVAGADYPMPDVTLTLDLSALSGFGQSSGKQYQTECVETLIRPLAGARDTVEVGFVFHQINAVDFSQYRAGQARFKLGFDVQARKLAAALGSIEGGAT
jgi:hypothetical protein